MVVGQDVPFRVYHNSGTKARTLPLRSWHVSKEITEEIPEKRVYFERRPSPPAGNVLNRADIDDRRRHLLSNTYKCLLNGQEGLEVRSCFRLFLALF